MRQRLQAMREEDAEARPRGARRKPAWLLTQWRRVVKRMSFYIGVMTQEYVLTLWGRTQRAVADPAPAQASAPASSSNRREFTGVGAPLARSTARVFGTDPSTCEHTEVRAGGGTAGTPRVTLRWWTCLGCGSRWQRLAMDATQETAARTSRAPLRPTVTATSGAAAPRPETGYTAQDVAYDIGLGMTGVRSCQECRRSLILRRNRRSGEQFYGCQGFASGVCSWTRPLSQAEREAIAMGAPPQTRPGDLAPPAPPPEVQDEFLQMDEDDILDETHWWDATLASADAAEAAGAGS